MQIGERIFRRIKQKTQAILCVLTSIFARYGGKGSDKVCAGDQIRGYQKKYGDERISTGILSHNKRVAARNRFKSRSLFKINDNTTVLKAA